MSKRKKKKYIKAPTTQDLEIMEKTGSSFSEVSASPIKKALDDALSEDVVELETITESKSQTDTPAKRKNSFKRNLYFTLGVFFTFMSLVGFIFSINYVGDVIKRIADNTEQKDFFAEYLYPIVVIDAPEFDNTYKLPSDVMLNAACWDIIFNADKSKYTAVNGYAIVPAIDVESHATKLFGESLSFVHQSIIDVESFEYDEDTKSYAIPLIPHYVPYMPKVEHISKIGERFTLTVGYYPASIAWMQKEQEREAEKYMEYVVVKRGNKYSVISAKHVSTDNSTL